MAFDSSPAPLPVCPSAAVPSFIHRSLCLQLCHPVHPPAVVSPCSQDSVLAPGAAAPAAAAAWLCPAEPLPPAERCVPLLPGTLPSALAPSRDAFSFATPPPPSTPSLASPHPQQLLPSPRCEFGFRPSPHPGQTLLGPHPPSQTPAAFRASFQQLFLGTCPRAALSPVPPLWVHSSCCCSLSPTPGSSPHLSPLVLPAGMPELGHGVLTSHFMMPQWCQDGEQENVGHGRSAAKGRPVGPRGKSLMCRGQPGPWD